MQTQEITKVENCKQFIKDILEPDYKDYAANLGSLRCAFHLAQSPFHLRDWTFAEYFKQGNWTYGSPIGKYQTFLENRSPSFKIVRDVANASKHLILEEKLKPSTPIRHASATQSNKITSFFPLFLNVDHLGGEVIAVRVDATTTAAFATIANDALAMWKGIFDENGWER